MRTSTTIGQPCRAPQPIVCRLTAPLSLMQERLRMREPGMFLDQALTRATELADILDRGGC